MPTAPAPSWSTPWNALPRGLRMAREAGLLALWDDRHWLTVLNAAGQVQAQFHRPQGVVAAAAAEDGSAFALIDGQGGLVRLGPDLKPVWEQRPAERLLAVALDPLGDYALASTAAGQLLLLDRDGKRLRKVRCPRPVHHAAFVPGGARAAAAADFGFVGCLELPEGQWAWRDTPVVYHGALAVAGDGEPVAVACFSDGARLYRRDGQPWPLAKRLPPCKLVQLTFDGRVLLSVGLDHALRTFDLTGKMLLELPQEQPPLAVALSGLGETVYVASADRRLAAYELPSPPEPARRTPP